MCLVMKKKKKNLSNKRLLSARTILAVFETFQFACYCCYCRRCAVSGQITRKKGKYVKKKITDRIILQIHHYSNIYPFTLNKCFVFRINNQFVVVVVLFLLNNDPPFPGV